jgi:hypothetical protein
MEKQAFHANIDLSALEFLLTAPEWALGGVLIGEISEVRDRQLTNQTIYIQNIFQRINNKRY